jgi:transaldolase
MEMVADICEIFAVQGIATEVIAASVRHPMHVLEAARVGVNIATVPAKVIDQMIEHPLTKAGIDKFLADWQKTEKQEASK